MFFLCNFLINKIKIVKKIARQESQKISKKCQNPKKKKGDEEDDSDEEEGHKKASLSTKNYPHPETITLPQPPDTAHMSPRVMIPQKEMPILLGQMSGAKGEVKM